MTNTSTQIYTDGACSGNPGPGGYAVVIIQEPTDSELILTGREELTTNNRMELSAFIRAMNHIKSHNITGEIEIFSDSKYLIDGVEKWLPNWKKRNWKSADNKPIKNPELWKEIDGLVQEVKFKFVWVKGHDGNKYNEMADQLAVEQVESFR